VQQAYPDLSLRQQQLLATASVINCVCEGYAD
jgi:hypothetical protein